MRQRLRSGKYKFPPTKFPPQTIMQSSQSPASKWTPTWSFHTVARPKVQPSVLSVYHLPASADFLSCLCSSGAYVLRSISRYFCWGAVAAIYDRACLAASPEALPRKSTDGSGSSFYCSEWVHAYGNARSMLTVPPCSCQQWISCLRPTDSVASACSIGLTYLPESSWH